MSIDWFTFVAQLVNFLVLVALLRHFLYGPITRAMREREERISSRLSDAANEKENARQKAQQYEQKTRELEANRDALMKQIHGEVEVARERLNKEARSEINRKRDEWRGAVERERRDIVSEVSRRAGEMGLEAARHALKELANEDLEARMFSAFLSSLRKMDNEHSIWLDERLGCGDSSVTLRSTFGVSDSAKEELRKTLREKFDYEPNVTYETAPDMVCGIEMDVDGQAFGWNVRRFLQDLEEEFEENLKAKIHKSAKREDSAEEEQS